MPLVTYMLVKIIKKLLSGLFMKKLLFLLPLTFLVNCKPDQVATEFEITVKPQAGKNVETSTKEDEPILVSYSVEEEDGVKNLSFDLVEQPKYGQLTGCKYITKTDWECIYTPYENFNGEDSLTFKTKNGDFQSNDESRLTITVTPMPDRPIAGADQKFTLMENTQKTFEISAVTDPDTVTKDLIFEIKTAPTNGELSNCLESGNPLSCTYIPNKEFYGEDYFEYSVTDEESKDTEKKSSARVSFEIMREWVPVSGISEIKIEDKASNALIVFAIDNSGSMEPYITHMKKSVANFVDDVASRGFQATIAFITSNQSTNEYKDVKTKEQPHPDYPNRAESWLELIKRVPKDSAIQIYEVNAYDYEWNEATKEKIVQTKSDIDDFLTNLPKGSDDERLLCSTLRFLHSDYTEGKDFVGVFTLANEDDAVDARTLDKAFTDCIKEKRQEYKPLASCNQVVECDEDDPDCKGQFTYTYTETILQPYPAVFSGKCSDIQPNIVKEDVDKRKYQLKEFKEVYREELDEENSEKIYTRVKIVNNPKKVNSRGKKILPTTTKRSGKIEVSTMDYRAGLKAKETTTIRSYEVELEKINMRKGTYPATTSLIRSGRKWRSQIDMRRGQVNLPKTAMRRGNIIIDKTEYRRIVKKLPILNAREGKKIVTNSSLSMEHCHDDWKTRDNLLGCITVKYKEVKEEGSCPTLPSTAWIGCSDIQVSKINGELITLPAEGYIAAEEIDEKGSCSNTSDYVSCSPIYKAKVDGILTEFGADELALQAVDEEGSCPSNLSAAGWSTCTNYWIVTEDGTDYELTNESDNRATPFDEIGLCSGKSEFNSCEDYKAVKVSGSYIDITIATNTQLTFSQGRQGGSCPETVPDSTWSECLQEYKAKVNGSDKYSTNPNDSVFLQGFDEQGTCTDLGKDNSICTNYLIVMIDDSPIEVEEGETKTKQIINEVGSCSNSLLNCSSFEGIKINGEWKNIEALNDSQKYTAVEEVGKCSEGRLNDCEDILKAVINGELVTVETSPAFQTKELEKGTCSEVSWYECKESYYVINKNGSESKIEKGQVVTSDEDIKGSACPEENLGWVECETYYTVVTLNGDLEEVDKDEETTLTINEDGACEELEQDSFISCTDSWTWGEQAWISIFSHYEETGKISDLIDEKGTCDTLPEDKVKWLSGNCIDYISNEEVEKGTKIVQIDCEESGGSTCSDHSDYFTSGTCKLKTPAGYNDPIINPDQTIKLSTRQSCLDVTGFEECTIAWSGEKTIQTGIGCELSKSSRVTHYFDPEEGKDKTLANGLVNTLKNNFTKAVYVSVINDYELNNQAVADAKAQNLNLPTTVCSVEYYEAREKYKSMRDGEVWYEMDGGEFMKVVEQMDDLGVTYSICSPNKYSSEKLDYLVAESKLNFKLPENDTVDKLKVTSVKIIYASGDSKTLASNEFTFANGAVTIIDPLLAKNIVEIHMNYQGYEK